MRPNPSSQQRTRTSGTGSRQNQSSLFLVPIPETWSCKSGRGNGREGGSAHCSVRWWQAENWDRYTEENPKGAGNRNDNYFRR